MPVPRYMHGRLPCAVLLSLLALVCACSQSAPVEPLLDGQAFLDPPVEYRPWVRWWWPGADVEEEEIFREIDVLASAGFGGFELQAFDAALDPDAPAEVLERRLAFDTARYHDLVLLALEAAEQAGLSVDLTFGSGWPPGGTHLEPADSLKTLMYNEWPVDGPAEVDIFLEPRKTVFYQVAELVAGFDAEMARFLPEHAEILCVLAARVTGGERDGSILNLTDTLELDPQSVLRLDDEVDGDGRLLWQAPEGRWQVIALFVAPDGEVPTLLAQPGEACVVDHLDAESVEDLALRFITDPLGPVALESGVLRAVFTDSLEFKAERLVAKDFLDEFERRRGYDITTWLPAVLVPGADNFIFEAGRLDREAEFSFGSDDERIRYDYRRTIAELFEERYIATLSSWAGQNDMRVRIQAYGADLDVIRAAGAADIPESEQLYAGGSGLFLRIASSAALLYDRKLASAESFVWPLRDYMTTPAKIKAGADKLFACGINQLVYHGYPYAHPGDYGLGGWSAFSSRYGGGNTFSSNFGEAGALFGHLQEINRYVARCQYLLQQGRQEVDLLVLYPWLGFPTSLALEPDFFETLLGGWVAGEPELREQPFSELAALFGDPVTDRRAAWLMSLQPVLEDLQARGFTWAWLDPASLAVAEKDGRLVSVRGARARALVLHSLPALEADLAEQLDDLAGRGVKVLGMGDLPGAQPGFHDRGQGDSRVAEACDRLAGRKSFKSIRDAQDGFAALDDLGVEPAVALSEKRPDLGMAVRRLENGARVIFIRNSGGEELAVDLELDGGCRDAYWLDAVSGGWAHAEEHGGCLSARLGGLGSLFLICNDGPPDEKSLGDPGLLEPLGPQAESSTLDSWDLRVTGDDVPGGEFTRSGAGLFDWCDEPDLRWCKSPGVYGTRFEAQPAEGRRYELDLGRVAGLSAAVELNGERVATLVIPPFRCELGPFIEAGENELVVTVLPAWRNHLVGLAAGGDERYAQFEGKDETLIATGLLGPVRLLWADAQAAD